MVKWTSVFALASRATPRSFLRPGIPGEERARSPDVKLFEDTLSALEVMQEAYFEPWVGTWPGAIDWTAAVLGTHIAGALHSISEGLDLMQASGIDHFREKENLVSLYFSQLIGFYFGQDAFSLRNQAFDDMLWVVLGWLDTINFAKEYSKTHFEAQVGLRLSKDLKFQGWHGNLWVPAFAHRARIFWHLAAAGWDTKLCGGGMNWNPRLMPYKNAITNELFIAGSVAMYLRFPGDKNTSPFGLEQDPEPEGVEIADWEPGDPKYLQAAVEGYNWLTTSNMTNERGLYADGFHISGYDSGNNTKCDERDEMVYTYNQGVLLTGFRGLYEATGESKYIREGHTLIQNVIRATGWDLARDAPFDDLSKTSFDRFPRWHGLGRAGVLEDVCDIRGDCSQDAQTFKGIWMHHFTTFCSPLSPPKRNARQSRPLGKDHLATCRRYYGWLKHNTDAALASRDEQGKFGMWWTIGLFRHITVSNIVMTPEILPEINGTDYRNKGVPNDPVWTGPSAGSGEPNVDDKVLVGTTRQQRLTGRGLNREKREFTDPNDRGRGRTVETQGGGVAVLRALWELSKLPGDLVTSTRPNL